MSDGLTAMYEEAKQEEWHAMRAAVAPKAFSNGSTQQRIIEVCDKIKGMLLAKNRKYGDSALNPIRIFAKSDNLEQIRVRIDDKLNRLKNQQHDEDEDVVDDLIGYLVLYKIAKERS